MKIKSKIKAVVIGGSAGSIPVLNSILAGLPEAYPLPVIICVHRMKNVSEGMLEVLSRDSKNKVVEPDDKEMLLPGRIYVAPSNYHLLIAPDRSVSLCTDRLVNYSRPSIDLTLISAANVFKKELTGILLTGANKDGARGMAAIKNNGGITIVQDPKECTAPYMPEAAIELNCVDLVLQTWEIISYLQHFATGSGPEAKNLK